MIKSQNFHDSFLQDIAKVSEVLSCSAAVTQEQKKVLLKVLMK